MNEIKMVTKYFVGLCATIVVAFVVMATAGFTPGFLTLIGGITLLRIKSRRYQYFRQHSDLRADFNRRKSNMFY